MKSPAKHLIHHDLISGLLIIAVVLVNFVAVQGKSDHCKERRFTNSINTSYMQFTKETVNQEYAIEGEFKNLHCCAKGYRSIEWWVFFYNLLSLVFYLRICERKLPWEMHNCYHFSISSKTSHEYLYLNYEQIRWNFATVLYFLPAPASFMVSWETFASNIYVDYSELIFIISLPDPHFLPSWHIDISFVRFCWRHFFFDSDLFSLHERRLLNVRWRHC